MCKRKSPCHHRVLQLAWWLCDGMSGTFLNPQRLTCWAWPGEWAFLLPWVELVSMSTAGENVNGLESFLRRMRVFFLWTVASKLCGNGLITLSRLRGSNNCFSKIITDIFPPFHCVNTPRSASTVKTFAFIGVRLRSSMFNFWDNGNYAVISTIMPTMPQ